MPELTEKGRRTRRRIVEATALRILDAGVDGTSLDDVRAATLTSKSQLFHYFPGGKAELVRAVAQWEGEQLLAAQEPHLSDLSTWESWESWRRGLEDYYLGLGRWACPIGSLTAQLAAVDTGTAALLQASWRDWRSRVADGVRRMQARGLIVPEVDPDRLATSVLAAIQGGLLLSQPERASWPLEAALDTAWTALHAQAVPDVSSGPRRSGPAHHPTRPVATSAAVNELVRRGMSADASPPPPFVQRTFPMGSPRIALDDIAGVLDALEGDGHDG